MFSENWTKGLSQHIMELTYNGVNTMSRERWPVDSLREFSQAPVSILIMIQPNISILIMIQPSIAIVIMIQPSIAMLKGATSTVVHIDQRLKHLALYQSNSYQKVSEKLREGRKKQPTTPEGS